MQLPETVTRSKISKSAKRALQLAADDHERRAREKNLVEKTYLLEQKITLKLLARKGSDYYRSLKGVGSNTVRELSRFFYSQGMIVHRVGWLNNHLYWPYTDDMPDD